MTTIEGGNMNFNKWPIDNDAVGVTNHYGTGEVVECQAGVTFDRLRCGVCGGVLLTTKELIPTTGGDLWREKTVCVDQKATGCPS